LDSCASTVVLVAVPESKFALPILDKGQLTLQDATDIPRLGNRERSHGPPDVPDLNVSADPGNRLVETTKIKSASITTQNLSSCPSVEATVPEG
jgi:hypothetical protein